MEIIYQNITITGSDALECWTAMLKALREQLEYTFDQQKAWAVAETNRQAELMRGQYITLLPGKIGEYNQKKWHYDKWLAAGSPAEPDPLEYPIAATESVEYSISIAEMLAVWGERAALWEAASAQIAAIERRALVAVEAAEDEGDLAAALAGLA